ncbi:hypothetical protein GB937_001341 [Aspergillus fischeri]|nr:hypothetical protein GB937_001341 [Aspergillus fischeri]
MAPRPGKSTGVNKTPHRMKTRARTRHTEALQRRLNDLHAQSNENVATRQALEIQIKEVQQRLQNPEIINKDEDEAQLKALFHKINQVTEKEEAIQAQIKAADEEQQGSAMDVDQESGSHPPDFAQTREDRVPVDDSDENSTPTDYADISPAPTIDLTGDDEAERWGLDGGITLAMSKAGRGSKYLNSYGPKSCAVLVWEHAKAERTVDRLTNIRGNPHRKALETDDEGDLIHRGKIRKTLNVAWEPKRKIRTIEDLLDSVEELNPQNKDRDPKYRYPFSTVLVEWPDGLERTWINRTNYKALSSQSKASTERTDRKFYQIGLLQVRRYREFLWGDRSKLGDLERTPPGLTESPEPGESNAIRVDSASHPASNNLQGRGESNGASQVGQVQGAQNVGDQTSPSDSSRPGQVSLTPSSPNQGSQNAGSQTPSSQNPGSGSQGQAGQHLDNQNQGGQSRGGQTQGSPSHDNKPRTMRSFYTEWLRENDLDTNTDVSTLGDELFGRFKAAAHAYVDEYKRKFGQQLQDDMDILKR